MAMVERRSVQDKARREEDLTRCGDAREAVASGLPTCHFEGSLRRPTVSTPVHARCLMKSHVTSPVIGLI
eukprot:6494042-Prymnesium_polylepis.1